MGDMNESFKDTKPIHIGDSVGGDKVGGDKFGGDKVMGDQTTTTTTVTGNENIIGDNNKVIISSHDIEEMKKSLEEFQKVVNNQLSTIPNLAKPNLAKQQINLQDDINNLSIAAENIRPNEPISEEKKEGITKVIKDIADKLVDMSPDIAETIASMTPLAPFSKSIGKGVSYFKDLINHKKNEP